MKKSMLEVAHSMAKALHEINVIDDLEMKEFDRQCLSPVTSNYGLFDRGNGNSNGINKLSLKLNKFLPRLVGSVPLMIWRKTLYCLKFGCFFIEPLVN